ncbi:MAG: hypothetical protein KIT35_28720 [Piscinibacter sp.]|uniref:hypothetical protein n=1 Tax=Piscinibacter sp. TaxID=1903157 RepID=UPI002583A86E|nr:hypothetical protein [Piscinibacter sp.]MCW5667839.1 hypothetical protein [Piscinibacter sp.]
MNQGDDVPGEADGRPPSGLGLADALAAEAKAGKLSLSIQIPWTHEPVERAARVFEGIWGWLTEVGANDWNAVESLAQHFHPDYQMDQKTRSLDPNRAPGATVYLQMERGEFSPVWIKAVAPTLYGSLPKVKRGKSAKAPTEYLIATLFLSAQLAAHEFANLNDELRKKSPNLASIARHLYYFERFSSLWRRIGQNRPATLDLNHAKRRTAESWRDDLLAYHRQRVSAHPERRVSARESAKRWSSDKKSPTFEVAYRALQQALKSIE